MSAWDWLAVLVGVAVISNACLAAHKRWTKRARTPKRH